MDKLVSIVMTVYNAQEFLAEAIQSILDQTYTNYEFIIVDDCSTDKSLQIAQEFQHKDTRIQIHEHEQNMGISIARNTGLKLAHGKYIAWMDADDVSMPDRIEKELTFLENNPNVGVVSSYVNLIDRQGNLIGDVKMPQTQILISWALCFYDPIINPAVMINRDLYTRVGDYRNLAENKGDYFPEDYDLWVRMINETRFSNLGEPLVKLRKHEQNITKTKTQSTMMNSIRICGWYFQLLNIPSLRSSDAELLWKPATSSTLFPTYKVVNLLYRYFIAKEGITYQEKEYIKWDYIYRIKVILSQVHFCFTKPLIYILMRSYQILFLLEKYFVAKH
jgi:glycosyltransferase involved in cell wall biosynthesis